MFPIEPPLPQNGPRDRFDSSGEDGPGVQDGSSDQSNSTNQNGWGCQDGWWATPGVEAPDSVGGGRDAMASIELRQALVAVEGALATLAELANSDFPDDDGLALIGAELRLRQALDRGQATRLAMVRRIDESDAWRGDEYVAARRFASWLAKHDDISLGTANAEVRTATHLAENLPETRRRFLAGEATAEQVKVLCTGATTSADRLAALRNPVANWETVTPDSAPDTTAGDPVGGPPTGEAYLLDVAASIPFGQFQRAVRRFAYLTDPEADERGYRVAQEREYLQLSPTLGGYHVAGFLTEEHGQQVKVAIENLVDAALTNDGNIVSELTRRTRPQRRADALAGLAQLAMDTGLLGGGAIERREIVVNVSWAEFNALQRKTPISQTSPDGTGHQPGQSTLDLAELADPGLDFATYADGHGPIPRSVLRRLACDSNIRRVVFGPEGQILDVGRSQRTVPPHVRAAVIARDKHCVYPNCEEPPQRGEIHHAVTHWADGGETSAENAAVLCWHHHAYVDGNGVTMKYDTPKRAWRFTNRNGAEITSATPTPAAGQFEEAS